MANRFPLILNTSSNQIQEIASGDTLDLTGSGLNLTGITTLSSSAELNLQGGTNINTGTRGDILFYNASGTIQKLSLGASGKILKSNGSDLVYGDTGSIANVYYVSTSGTDGSGFGSAIDRPFRSIKYACSNIGTPSATAPAIIFVKAGVYEEAQLPIVVPAHTTIAGDSLRATILKPASGLDSGGSIQNNRSTMFKMSNATVLQDLVMDGMGGYTAGSPAYKPESATIGGIYLALNNASPVTTKSPYIYNVTSFGDGATGAVLDGSVHASGNRSMLFHTYTAVHSDGLGIFLKANANAEMISTFTYYCQVGFACIGGSKIRSLNSSNAYGEYGVYSAGFDAGETANQGTIKGQMLVYTNVLTTSFQDGEQITGGTSNATAYVVNVQAEPKRIYIVSRSGTFQSNETVTGGTSGATATLTSGTATVNQSGRILVTTFSTSPDAGDSLQFASTDGNAFQIQSVSSVTANSVAYKVLVFSTSRATAVAENVNVLVRKEFSLARLTGHDFLQIGTGGYDTTNWPNNPTQDPDQADQVITNETDPGRVYYTATDDLGNFYVGDQFKVDQATGNVTLDASAFNLSGLESLRLGSVGGLIGAAVNEFSTDTGLTQSSNTKVPTQNAVKVYVDTLDGVVPDGGTFTVAGISTVTGTTFFTKQLNVSGVTTFHGNVNFLDGDRLRIGSSEDLQLYHDGSHSYIAENGTGDLKLQATAGSILLQRDNGHEMVKANVGGSVELFHNDSKKIETSSTGVTVTGTAVATAVDVDDFIDVGSNIKLGNAGVVTATSFVGDGQNLTNTGSTLSEPSSGTHRIVTTSLTSGTMTTSGTDSVLSFNYGTHTLAATNFSGSGASLTNLNATNLSSGTVPIARLGDSGTKSGSTFLAGDNTFKAVTVAINSIANDGGNRVLTSDGDGTATAESSLTFDGSTLGASGNVLVGGHASPLSSYQSSQTRLSIHKSSGSGAYLELGGAQNTNGTSSGTILFINDNNADATNNDANGKIVAMQRVEIVTSDSNNDDDSGGDLVFMVKPEAANLTERLRMDSVGQILPGADNTQNLGSSSKRWKNIYSADLHCSNKGSKNDVDGTWGDFTIQEGESDLFLINNRSGKKYKFNLTEVN